MMDGHVLPKCFSKRWVSNFQQRRKYKMELLNGTHHSSMSISLKDVISLVGYIDMCFEYIRYNVICDAMSYTKQYI